MDWSWWKQEVSDLAFYWVGWQALDFLRLAAGGSVLTAGAWLIARYRKSPLQRELRGAFMALVFLTITL
jgi:hypothetical protein